MKRALFRLLPILILFVLIATVLAQTACTIVTDKADYSPGEVAQITGTGWEPGEIVDLLLTKSCGCPGTSWSVNADANGNIATDYTVQDKDLGVAFTLTALSSMYAKDISAKITRHSSIRSRRTCGFSRTDTATAIS